MLLVKAEGYPVVARHQTRIYLLYVKVFSIALSVILLDQVTKALAVRVLSKGPIHVFGPLSLTLLYNSGIAFGLAKGMSDVVILLAVLIVLFIGFRVSKASSNWSIVGSGLLMGGAISNVIDRLIRPHFGVVDFIDFKFWPVFNLADASIVIGVVMLVFASFKSHE